MYTYIYMYRTACVPSAIYSKKDEFPRVTYWFGWIERSLLEYTNYTIQNLAMNNYIVVM